MDINEYVDFNMSSQTNQKLIFAHSSDYSYDKLVKDTCTDIVSLKEKNGYDRQSHR